MQRITFTLDGFKPFTFDPEKHYLGTLCCRGRAVPGTSASPRNKSRNACVFCERFNARPDLVAEARRRQQQQEKDRQELAVLYHGVTVCLSGFEPFMFRKERHTLGDICKRGHEFAETGLSARVEGKCVFCRRLIGSRHMVSVYHKKLKHDPIYQEANRENLKRYYRSHPDYRDRCKAKSLAHSRTPEGRIARKRNAARRKAILKSVHGVKVSVAEIKQHFSLFGNACAYCGNPERLSLDHFIAIAAGGSNCLGNFVPACVSCNASKQDSDPRDWYKRQPFFDLQRWKKILRVLGKTEATYNQIPLL